MEQTMLSDTNDSTSMCSITSVNDGNNSDFSERKYKNSIKKFLKELICKHDDTFEDCDASDLELDVWESNSPTDELLMDKNDTSPCDEYIEEIDCISPQINEVDKSKQPTVGKYPKAVDTPGDSNLFFIDTIPAVKDTRSVPTYNQNDSNFKLLVEEVEKAKSAVVSTSSPRALSMCFNCGGSHSLRDCKEPRNHTSISKNRQQFKNKQAAYQSRARHAVLKKLKYAHFSPGKISNSLRHALGLYENELPKHIYRMRQLGYPPGWLGDAKIFHSGITVFNEEGKEVINSDDEEGEILTVESKVKYDPSKIIKFPGFNVPPPLGTTDDFQYYNCPPMLKEQSLDVMLEQLGPTYMGGKRRRTKPALQAQSATPPIDQDLTSADMEVEDMPGSGLHMLPQDNCRFVPPLPKDTPPRLPPPPMETPPRPPLPSTESDSDTRSLGPTSPISTSRSSVSSPRPQSPSLSDLETKKLLLLAELEDGGSSNDTGPLVPAPVGSTVQHTPVSLGKVKNMNLGTPLLDSLSPYTRLPQPEQFSKDVSDVINFENLPNYTGTYERMSGVLNKVRKVLSHEEQFSK
uniref:PSP proline-rich domain-containing protein n=1 Tax=Timema cristinae TaxID=61476 RepID=A0A7R9CWK3_TIMCR|nr:unnamed protein product [Timema cristinae]